MHSPLFLVFICISASLVSGKLEVNQCGVSKVVYDGDRIVGGREAERGEFPWQISLQRRSWTGRWSHSCGGSILNENWIITAAHCVNEVSPSSLRVVAAGHSLSSVNAEQSNHLVSEIIMHPKYDDDTTVNDIALLRLATPIDLAASKGYANGVCLPKNGQQFNGYATVSGWGTTSEGGKISKTLQAVELPLISWRQCRSYLGSEVNENMYCAGYPSGGKDSCQGDSGGPLVQRINGKGVLVGVVSWGYGCARPNAPGVYTDVSKFLDWIEANAY